MTDLIRNKENFGILGNVSNYVVLSMLSEKKQKQYREYLQKKNPEAYAEYLKFEKEFDKLQKD